MLLFNDFNRKCEKCRFCGIECQPRIRYNRKGNEYMFQKGMNV